MKTIEYRGRMIRVPEEIDELTPAQYRRYLEISIMAGRGLINRAGLRGKLLTLLLGERTDLQFQTDSIQEEALTHIGLTTPFILSGEKRDRLWLETGTNLLKEWEGWSGPGDMLDGMTFGAFIDCNSLLKMLSKAHSTDETERLTAAFCKKLYTNREKPDAKPDELLCAHALILFNNVTKALHGEPVEINGEPIRFAILFEKPDRRKPDDHTGWTGAALDIAETGTFGTYRQVLETPLWDILLYLYRKKFDHKYNHKNGTK